MQKRVQLNKGLLVLFVGILSAGCQQKTTTSSRAALRTIESQNYKLPVYDFDHFKQFLKVEEEGVVRVLNFWATWCAPCVKELPAFQQLYTEFKGQKVEVILVSLDFPDQIETGLIPFIKRSALKMPVIYLDDPHTNEWIPEISEEWSGALPATLIITQDSYTFYERSFTSETLKSAVLTAKNN